LASESVSVQPSKKTISRRKRRSATIRERYREISVKGHEKRRVDSTEGVKRGGNAQAKSEREKVSREEVRTS
jgi:hypothetical protein